MQGRTLSDRTWHLSVESDKNERGSPYWVLVFVGEVPDDKSEWRTSPSLIGDHYAMPDNHFKVSTGEKANPSPVRSAFAFEPRFRDFPEELPTREPKDVLPFIKKHIRWRVLEGNDEVVSNEKLSSLKLYVLSLQGHEEPVEHCELTKELTGYAHASSQVLWRAGGLGVCLLVVWIVARMAGMPIGRT